MIKKNQSVLFDGKKILITGGTGSLGTALTKKLLETGVDAIRIFSRDEWKQTQMQHTFNDDRLRFFIGDVRDKERLSRALEDVNIVIHTAALKQVPVAEYNPFEAIKTNVYGAQNVIDGCFNNNVELALAISTDKAVSPFNTYGSTKLLMEKLFTSANYYKGIHHKIKFLGVRYGNVIGSRGSIVPTFVNQINKGKKITLTDPTMTRFNITMTQSLDLIFRALKTGIGGELFVPKLKAYIVGDLKDAILELLDSHAEIEKINVRPGEKFHESLISLDEVRNTYETEMDYVVFDKDVKLSPPPQIPYQQKSALTDQYSSDKVELLSKEELKEILINEKLIS